MSSEHLQTFLKTFGSLWKIVGNRWNVFGNPGNDDKKSLAFESEKVGRYSITKVAWHLYSSMLLHAEVLPFQREGVKVLINLCNVIHQVPCYLHFCEPHEP